MWQIGAWLSGYSHAAQNMETTRQVSMRLPPCHSIHTALPGPRSLQAAAQSVSSRAARTINQSPRRLLGARRRVQGAEHLLAALEMLGVENCRIEIEGGHEVPIIDGSAQGWCVEIQAVRPTPLPT